MERNKLANKEAKKYGSKKQNLVSQEVQTSANAKRNIRKTTDTIWQAQWNKKKSIGAVMTHQDL